MNVPPILLILAAIPFVQMLTSVQPTLLVSDPVLPRGRRRGETIWAPSIPERPTVTVDLERH